MHVDKIMRRYGTIVKGSRVKNRVEKTFVTAA